MENQNDVTNLEEQSEKLANENQILLDANSSLVEQIKEIEKHLIEEKQLRDELPISYEDSDRQKEKTIIKHGHLN